MELKESDYKYLYKDTIKDYVRINEKYNKLLEKYKILEEKYNKLLAKNKKDNIHIVEATENEIWSETDEYPNYKISNIGRVMKNNGKMVTLRKNKGYVFASVKNKYGKTKHIGVHRLVALAFIPNTENKKEVDHINTKRDDNRVENLRWVDPLENIFNPLTYNKLKDKPNLFYLTLKGIIK